MAEEIDPGHLYALQVLDSQEDRTVLRFVKREGPNYPRNVGHYPGTTMQEVLRAVVQRADYVDKQIFDYDTQIARDLCKQAIFHLEARAARRHGRPVDFGIEEAVTGITCPTCGHIHCGGHDAAK